ncbi:MAG TPA: branched-chain amino acid ABC transporter permease [Ilumatobacteraceae bacterium]|nr:branched-chain amino acid ABC transporter permease [Ilumatobacteraceae bacterium]
MMIAAITGTNLLTFLITGLTVGGIYALSALGLVVVYRATGVLNFAQGAVGAIAALTLANEFIGKGRPEALGYIAAVALAIVLSLFYGLVISPRLSRRDPIVRAMGALGFGLFILGFCGWRWTARIQKLDLPTDEWSFKIGEVTVTLTRALVIVLALVVTVAITAFLNKTRVGLSMRSLANDRELSSMLGVDVRRAETVAWLMGGVIAGLSGILFGATKQLDASSLTFLVIPAIAAAVVGQLKSLWWTFAGAMLIGVIEAELTNFNRISPYKDITQLAVGAGVILLLQRSRVVSFVGADR